MQRGQAAKRLSILEAATAVFVREGVSAASIDLIAAEAGVSRQTVYNHVGDKERLFIAVVSEISARSSMHLFETLGTFPERPKDLESELIEFAIRLCSECMCDPDGLALRRLIENEGRRYPQLFETWKQYGPGKNWPAIAGRFAKLAHEGYLDIDDADLAARQFMALVNADLPTTRDMGQAPTNTEIRTAATNAVRTFLKAFSKQR
ncbi:MAG TPA: TetR/AcrR family transcriptional regulator [Devosiaceae bacterium]